MSSKTEHIKWKTRRSELSGCDRSVYGTDAHGDYVRADFSVKNKRLRLTVENVREGRVVSIIDDGRIIEERVSGKVRGRASSVLASKAFLFCVMPGRSIVPLAHGHYGICRPNRHKGRTRNKKKRQIVFGVLVLFIATFVSAVIAYLMH